MRSSLMTRRSRKCTCSGSLYSANEKVCRLSSQSMRVRPRCPEGRTLIIGIAPFWLLQMRGGRKGFSGGWRSFRVARAPSARSVSAGGLRVGGGFLEIRFQEGAQPEVLGGDLHPDPQLGDGRLVIAGVVHGLRSQQVGHGPLRIHLFSGRQVDLAFLDSSEVEAGGAARRQALVAEAHVSQIDRLVERLLRLGILPCG